MWIGLFDFDVTNIGVSLCLCIKLCKVPHCDVKLESRHCEAKLVVIHCVINVRKVTSLFTNTIQTQDKIDYINNVQIQYMKELKDKRHIIPYPKPLFFTGSR